MIHQLNMFGKDKVQTAIERLRMFEPQEGYFLAFSGGKDSVVLKALADMAMVKYDAHYNITSVDPPELVQFIKTFPDVSRDHQHWDKDGVFVKKGDPITMWNLIPEKKFPPTRLARFCCEKLKEGSGGGRFVLTGVRWDESAKRRGNRAGLEIGAGQRIHLDPDNPDNEEMVRVCPTKFKKILNPIIDWTTAEIWEFITEYKVPYCHLYDEGFTRLGCIGCPMGGRNKQERDFERWPTYRKQYVKAFSRMLLAKDGDMMWKSGEEVMAWWLGR